MQIGGHVWLGEREIPFKSHMTQYDDFAHEDQLVEAVHSQTF